jgi:hypothetical protein
MEAVMENWDDFMMDRPLAAWSIVLGIVFVLGGGLGLIAMLAGMVAFGITAGALIVALVVTITH